MTQIGEGIVVSASIDDPDKYITAQVIEFEFVNCFKACLGQATIKPPHWPAANDALNQSNKPAIFAFDNKGSQKIKVKIKVESKGYSGNGKLSGVVKGLEFEGDTPLTSGEHTVEVTLKDPPNALLWVKAKIGWKIETGDKILAAGNTHVEVFFVFTDPSKVIYFSKNGVWIEALRFIVGKGKLETTKKETDAVASVTSACFSLPNHKYEVERGKAGFGGATKIFQLKKYMSSNLGAVNCYDQTYAVIVFSGALGVGVDGLFLQPFGYIKSVNLVGWGRCNNPFPHQYPVDKFLEVAATDQKRSSFGNHMFCEFKVKIYDACAGPVKGAVDRAAYISNTIDTDMPNNAPFGYPGKAAQILNIIPMGYSVASVE